MIEKVVLSTWEKYHNYEENEEVLAMSTTVCPRCRTGSGGGMCSGVQRSGGLVCLKMIINLLGFVIELLSRGILPVEHSG